MGGATMAAAPPTAAIPGYGYGPGEQPPRGNRRRIWLPVALGGIVLAAFAVVAYFPLVGANAKTYAVPRVNGLSYTKAAHKIAAAHLRPQRISTLSRAVAENHVVGTDPRSGTRLRAGSTVEIFTSTGPAPKAGPPATPSTSPTAPQPVVSVPDVVGEDATAAQADLAKAGLHAVAQTDNTSTVPVGTVVGQTPPGGTKVSPGSTVTISVSGGVTVQDVVGDPVDTAKSILEGQGFKVIEVDQPSSPGTAVGIVYAQNPAAGTLLPRGGTVTIYVQPVPPPHGQVPAGTGPRRVIQ
jgi:beta-lactam-binding protein with PASTA domain